VGQKYCWLCMRVLTFCWLAGTLSAWGQQSVPGAGGSGVEANEPPQLYELHIKKAAQTVKVDGLLNEPIWKNADVGNRFFQNFPADTSYAEALTEVMVAYDDRFLYIAAVCHNEHNPGQYVVSSLRRDFGFGGTDNLSVYLDPYNDKTNGFTFSVSPFGAQREGMMSNGDNVSNDWDNKWYSAVERTPTRWTVEMAIPWKSIRYNDKARSWNINFARRDNGLNETSCWFPVPLGYRVSSLAYTGKIIWNEPPPKAGANVALIPYISTGGFRDYEAAEGTERNDMLDVGMDAKVALSSSLNLDLTINPDFSQVEVDQQVTNLSRFELFFPERRQFFLENADLFARFGFSRIRPFFSRRIGLTSPMQAGARLSGKIGQNWRVGLMNVQTGEAVLDEGTEDEEVIPSTNYTVASFQRQVFSRSNIAGIFVNKQGLNVFETDSTTGIVASKQDYNRVFGLDYNLASADDKFNGKIFYHRSISPENNDNAYAHAMFLAYRDKHWFAAWNHEVIGENYNAETGFVLRTGVARFEPFVRYNFRPQNGVINVHGPRVRGDVYTDIVDGGLLDASYQLGYEVEFANTSGFFVEVGNEYIRLQDGFDPTNTDGAELPAGAEFDTRYIFIEARTDRRKLWNMGANFSSSGYFNGTRQNYRFDMEYRFQPYGRIALNVNYNRIRLPEPYNDADLLLIGPRVDLTFTDKLFLTTFVQYNNQQDNININTRFQWRFKPVSDLFVVYTDNYFANSFNVKSRSLVLKLTYWLNV